MSSADTLSTLANALTVATGVVAVLGFLVAVLAAGPGLARSLMTWSRWRSLRRVLAHGPLASWRVLARRSSQVVGAERHVPALELDWLATTLAVPSGLTWGTGLAPGVMRDIAAAYAEHAARLRSRTLWSTTRVPVLDVDARVSEQVAHLLQRHADGVPLQQRPWDVDLHDGARLRFGAVAGGDAGFGYEPWVSYRRSRIVSPPLRGTRSRHDVDGVPLEYLADVPGEQLQRLDAALTRPGFFDGVLPRLLQGEVLHDIGTGRRVLHLALAECSYAAVVIDHYPPPGHDSPHRPVEGVSARLLTLAMLLETRDGDLVLTGRSARAGSHPGLVGPAVSGNLELRIRPGIAEDLDEDALPDPRRALARECREELGVELEWSDVGVLGLARWWDARERGSNLLVASAATRLSTSELLGLRGDPLEGAWEVGRDCVAVRLPDAPAAVVDLVRWAADCPDLTTAARACLLARLRVGHDVDLVEGALALPRPRTTADPAGVTRHRRSR